MEIEVKTKTTLVEKHLDDSIKKVSLKAKRFKFSSSSLRVVILLLSACATISIGLVLEGSEVSLKNLALISSVLVTSLTALEPFFNLRALWIAHEEAKAQFYSLKEEFDFYIAGNDKIKLQELERFEVMIQSIWRTLSKTWIQERRNWKESLEGSD